MGALSLARESHPPNAYSPTDSIPTGSVTDVSESHSLNAYVPMDVTFFRSNAANVEPGNAYFPTALRVEGRLSEEARRCIPSPRVVIPSEIMTWYASGLEYQIASSYVSV